MQTDTTPLTYDTPHGTLYVAVATAREDHYHDSERGNVTDLRPRLWVASNPTFEADPNHVEHWTIRGRAYGVSRAFKFHDQSHITYDNGVNAGRWHRESARYQGGYITDRGKKVEFRTPTYEAIEGAITDTLDKFATDHPQWGELSAYLLYAHKHSSAVREAADLRRKAEEEEEKASALWGEAEPLINALPLALTDLIRR